MNGSYRHSAEHLSELVGAIYDCVLAPAKWTQAIAAIGAAFDFQNSILAINGYDGRALVGVVVGVDDYWLSRMLNYGTAVTDGWGGMEKIAQYPLEEPIVLSRAMPSLDLDRNPYFAEWARPQGIIDAVAVALERNAVAISNLSLGRHERAGPVSDADVDSLRLLAPHLRRAVSISQVLELKTIEASTFASTMDTLSSAILIVDINARCLHANDAAKAMVETGDPIALRDGELVLPRLAGHIALKEAVRGAASPLVTSRSRGAGIPATRRDGSPVVLHVMPLHRPELSRPIDRRAVAAVFVSPSTSPPQMPADALSLLYALTRRKRVSSKCWSAARRKTISRRLSGSRSARSKRTSCGFSRKRARSGRTRPNQAGRLALCPHLRIDTSLLSSAVEPFRSIDASGLCRPP